MWHWSNFYKDERRIKALEKNVQMHQVSDPNYMNQSMFHNTCDLCEYPRARAANTQIPEMRLNRTPYKGLGITSLYI